MKGMHHLFSAQHQWNPKTLIRVNVNPRRGQLNFDLPVTDPLLVEIHHMDQPIRYGDHKIVGGTTRCILCCFTEM